MIYSFIFIKVFCSTVALSDGEFFWWDAERLHERLCLEGYRLRKIRFISFAKDLLSRANVPANMMILDSSAPPHFYKYVLTTFAQIMLLWMCVDACRQMEDVYMSFMQNMVAQAVHALPLCGSFLYLANANSVFVNSNGLVVGFRTSLDSCVNRKVWPVILEGWSEMIQSGLLTEELTDEPIALINIVFFLSCFLKARRSLNKRPVSKSTHETFNLLRAALVSWLSGWIETYVQNIYTRQHNTDKPVPARRNSFGSLKRNYVQIEPSTVWHLVQEARTSHTSVSEVVRVRNMDYGITYSM